MPKVTLKEIAEFKAAAMKEGRDLAHLSSRQIARQIRILRGGLAAPSPSDLEEILARARKTEQAFRKALRGVLAELGRAVRDLARLDRPGAARPRQPRRDPVLAKARRLVALHRELLAYPPSMLPLAAQEALDLVAHGATLAGSLGPKGSGPGGEELSSLCDRLPGILDDLTQAHP